VRRAHRLIAVAAGLCLLAACGSTDAGVTALPTTGAPSTEVPRSDTTGKAPSASAAPSTTASSSPGQSGTGSSGSLDWKSCGSQFDCATLTVPIDWSKPTTSDTIDLFVKRFRSSSSGDRIGTMLVNPGGPGVPGTDLVDQADLAFTKDILDHFDIVSWDTRGSGRSEQIDCGVSLDDVFGIDPTPDTPEEVQAQTDSEKKLADGCERGAGALLPYMATEDTARDMDALRAALGEDKVSYFGFSYGSTLGAVYATLFPEHVRAMVIDGATDPDADTATSARQTTVGLERSLDEALAQCSADSSCPFHNGGNAEGAFDALMQRLDDTPIVVSKDRPAVGQGVAYTAILSTLYADYYWPQLMQALAAAQNGDASQLLSLYDAYLRRLPGGDFEGIFESLFAVNCIDDPGARDPAVTAELQQELPRLAPRLGAWAASGNVCGVWPAPARTPVKVTGAGAGPIVVIGTTGDPVTPLDATTGMAKALEGGILVTVDSEQHTGYGTNDCVNEAVAKYLVDLKPPQAGLVCK